MVTQHNMPEEIKRIIREHDLVRPDLFADEKWDSIQQAQDRVVSLVMTTFVKLAGQPSGSEVLWNSAREHAAIGTGQDTPDPIRPRGEGLVKELLDDRYHGTVNSIATAARVRGASVVRLIDLVTAAALDVLGGLVNERRWTAQELGQWLRTSSAVPAIGAPTLVARPVPQMTAPSAWHSKRVNVLLVVAALIAAAEFGYIVGTRSTSNADALTASSANNSASGGRQYTAIPVANLSAPTASNSYRNKAAVPVVLKLKNGVRQIIGANSTESKLYQFLIDPEKEVDLSDPAKAWIGFDRIYFDTNKATLTNESLWQLSNVALILKRFPATKIKIGGYTDNAGNSFNNLKLSRERAQAARTALIGLGVPADHLEAVGYGSLDNLADNDTEEGRALNRRVSLLVTQK